MLRVEDFPETALAGLATEFLPWIEAGPLRAQLEPGDEVCLIGGIDAWFLTGGAVNHGPTKKLLHQRDYRGHWAHVVQLRRAKKRSTLGVAYSLGSMNPDDPEEGKAWRAVGISYSREDGLKLLDSLRSIDSQAKKDTGVAGTLRGRASFVTVPEVRTSFMWAGGDSLLSDSAKGAYLIGTPLDQPDVPGVDSDNGDETRALDGGPFLEWLREVIASARGVTGAKTDTRAPATDK